MEIDVHCLDGPRRLDLLGKLNELDLKKYPGSSELAARLTQDFQNDLAQSRQVTYQEWKTRPVWERAFETAGWFLQRQQ